VTSLRALLADAVDYAGLYPPASVDMHEAVTNYAEYRQSDDAWMLGRFVLPASGLSSFDIEWRHVGEPSGWLSSAVLGENPEDDIALVHAFNDAHHGRVRIDTVEARLTTPGAIARAAAAAQQRLTVFVEIPATADLPSIISAIGESGVGAKIRTGGTTPDAFPRADSIAQVIRRCVAVRVPFKATAGLHHPLRAEYRLTYKTDAPRGMMFGYLNVFLAAGFAVAGIRDDELTRLLEETDAAAIRSNDRGIAWRGHELTIEQVREARQWLRSFGSCSFREPVDELAALDLAS